MLTISKIEAADRQFNAGVESYFSGKDPLIAHALIAASLNIYGDLSTRKGVESWLQKAVADNGLDVAYARSLFNRAWNFFKHADRDPDGVLQFDPVDTEHLAMFATLERITHGGLTRHMEVLQCWYLAKHPIESQSDLLLAASVSFPNLGTMSYQEQLAAGETYLRLNLET